MKEEKEQTSAVGMHMTLMVELIIMRMLQPMKDMISELKTDVDSIKEWCINYISVEKFNELVVDIKNLKSDVELSINEAINSLALPTAPQLDIMFSDIEGKVGELDDRVDELEDLINEVEDSRVDNESTIEDNQSNMEEIVSKLGLIGDILNE